MEERSSMYIYVGYDSANLGQEMAYQVCRRSIFNNARRDAPLAVLEPLKLSDLKEDGLYWRKDDSKQSTEFTYSRFLTPYIAFHEDKADYAIFCDSDFLWRCNIEELLYLIDPEKAVTCVQHKYIECPSLTKMDGLAQEWYPKKNWSSLMLFNCNHEDCQKLTPEVVNTESPKYLHRMEWTSEENIGSFPVEYNYLVGYYNYTDNPKALHFTDGGPWHKDHQNVEYADEWLSYLSKEEKEKHKSGSFWS